MNTGVFRNLFTHIPQRLWKVMKNLVCRACDKGHASFDQRHRLIASTIYDLPFRRGRKFGSNINQAADYVVGGWTFTASLLDSRFSLQHRLPRPAHTLLTGPTASAICDGADSSLSDNLRNNGMVYFKTSCFAAPATGFFGNTGRAPLHGPGINNWDIGLEKQFPIPITEQMKLQFRGSYSMPLIMPSSTIPMVTPAPGRTSAVFQALARRA